jgi:hypothetical protein
MGRQRRTQELVKGETMADHPNFWDDIFPLFTDADIACMRARGVLLADVNWWKDETNWQTAVGMLKSGRMPLGGIRWDQESIKNLQDWIDKGFPEGDRPTNTDIDK